MNYSYIFPGFLEGYADAIVKMQGLLSFGKNSDGTPTPEQFLPLPFNMNLEKKVALDFEASMPLGQGQKITSGLSMLFDLSNPKQLKPEMNFYVSCKMNWVRF